MRKGRKSSETKMAQITAKAIFSFYDKDGNGFLDTSEVLQFIIDLAPQFDPSRESVKPEVVMENLLKVADENKDNKISIS
jgi:Ca2+-binding EF-hand superfamily protein